MFTRDGRDVIKDAKLALKLATTRLSTGIKLCHEQIEKKESERAEIAKDITDIQKEHADASSLILEIGKIIPIAE